MLAQGLPATSACDRACDNPKVERRVFHLLLVEDNPADVGLFKHACKECNIRGRLHVAADGSTAMRFLRKEKEFNGAPTPDVLVLDLNLPMIGGHEILQMVKADPELRSIPVIILTSSDCRREIHQAYAEGAACFITKPTDVDQYFAAVKASERFWLRTATLPVTSRSHRAASAGSN
jgi:chemotaxis family two-component system response regulator Rcp1